MKKILRRHNIKTLIKRLRIITKKSNGFTEF